MITTKETPQSHMSTYEAADFLAGKGQLPENSLLNIGGHSEMTPEEMKASLPSVSDIEFSNRIIDAKDSSLLMSALSSPWGQRAGAVAVITAALFAAEEAFDANPVQATHENPNYFHEDLNPPIVPPTGPEPVATSPGLTNPQPTPHPVENTPTPTERPPTSTPTDEPTPTKTKEPNPTNTQEPTPTKTKEPNPTATDESKPAVENLPDPTPKAIIPVILKCPEGTELPAEFQERLRGDAELLAQMIREEKCEIIGLEKDHEQLFVEHEELAVDHEELATDHFEIVEITKETLDKAVDILDGQDELGGDHEEIKKLIDETYGDTHGVGTDWKVIGLLAGIGLLGILGARQGIRWARNRANTMESNIIAAVGGSRGDDEPPTPAAEQPDAPGPSAVAMVPASREAAETATEDESGLDKDKIDRQASIFGALQDAIEDIRKMSSLEIKAVSRRLSNEVIDDLKIVLIDLGQDEVAIGTLPKWRLVQMYPRIYDTLSEEEKKKIYDRHVELKGSK